MIKPLVLIPSYNSGVLLESTVREVLQETGSPVWVVIDGSDDGSEAPVVEMERSQHRLNVILKPVNEGKGAAVRSGLIDASREGFSHVLVMDSDGQHPASQIDRMFGYAKSDPGAMILGQPVFDESVPLERLYGRKLSDWLVRFEVLGKRIGDALYGFRVYPVSDLLKVLGKPGRANRYDFDPEVAVRLCWMGVPSVKVDMPVKYIAKEQGGISHFHYLRDNARYVGLHFRLVVEAPFHWTANWLSKRKKQHECQ